MSTVTVTNSFVNGNANDGPQVTQNFTDLTSYINANCITKDGGLALTALLTGPATDPTSDNHLARKKYVDDRTGLQSGTNTTASDTNTAVNTFQDMGTIQTITNPGKAVNVLAICSGFVQNVGFNSQIKVKVGISFDNGGTYAEQQQFIDTDPAHTYMYPFSVHRLVSGTPSGNIKIRAQHLGKDVANIVGWEPATTYLMWKTVTV